MKLFYRICTATVLCAAATIILPAQTVTTLFVFGETNGAYGAGDYDYGFLEAALVQGIDGYLYSFCAQSDCADGAWPYTGLVQATDGDLYATTFHWGVNGSLFKITRTGVLTDIFDFDCCAMGAFGNLYGTTSTGGTRAIGSVEGLGTIFSLSSSLDPFVKLQLTSGEVGELVEVLGNDLTGATAVSSNGTPATFKVASSSLIATNVFSSATTGKVQVQHPATRRPAMGVFGCSNEIAILYRPPLTAERTTACDVLFLLR